MKSTGKNLKAMRHLTWITLAVSLAVFVFGAVLFIKCGAELLKGGVHSDELAALITELAESIVLLVHYFFVSKFLIHSLRHGVPLTREGAKEVRILGLETVFLPVLVWIVSIIAYSGAESAIALLEISVYEIALGFVLILASFVMEYASERIEAEQRGHEAIRYIIKKYPQIALEARHAVEEMGYVFPEHLKETMAEEDMAREAEKEYLIHHQP